MLLSLRFIDSYENFSMFLSIIIPFKDRLDLPHMAISSLPDIANAEVILVDDGSNQKIDLPQNFTSLKFILSSVGANSLGAGAARNVGMALSSGDFIMFVDSDDIVNSDVIKKVVSEAELYSDVSVYNVSSIHNDFFRCDRHLKYNRFLPFIYRDSHYLAKHIVPWGKIFKASFIRDNAIKFEEIACSNDIGYMASVVVANPSVSIHNETLYCVRCSANSLTTKDTLDTLYVRYFALCRFNDLLANNKLVFFKASFLPLLLRFCKFSNFTFLKLLFKSIFSINYFIVSRSDIYLFFSKKH